MHYGHMHYKLHDILFGSVEQYWNFRRCGILVSKLKHNYAYITMV